MPHSATPTHRRMFAIAMSLVLINSAVAFYWILVEIAGRTALLPDALGAIDANSFVQSVSALNEVAFALHVLCRIPAIIGLFMRRRWGVMFLWASALFAAVDWMLLGFNPVYSGDDFAYIIILLEIAAAALFYALWRGRFFR